MKHRLQRLQIVFRRPAFFSALAIERETSKAGCASRRWTLDETFVSIIDQMHLCLRSRNRPQLRTKTLGARLDDVLATG